MGLIVGIVAFDNVLAHALSTLPRSSVIQLPAAVTRYTSQVLDSSVQNVRDDQTVDLQREPEIAPEREMSTSFGGIVQSFSGSLSTLPDELADFWQESALSAPQAASSIAPNTRVVRTIDGDTIVIEWKGKEESVRLIGVDTPESVDPRTRVQCFGLEASSAMRAKASGQRVTFIPDPSQGERDKYHRLLGYVFLADGTLLNQWLIREGYGFEYTYNLPYQYQKDFIAAEAEARSGERGLWNKQTCNGKRADDDGPSVWSPVRNDDRDCNSFATQKEAQHFFEANGGSPTSDPHNLDRDHDGLACELLP